MSNHRLDLKEARTSSGTRGLPNINRGLFHVSSDSRTARCSSEGSAVENTPPIEWLYPVFASASPPLYAFLISPLFSPLFSYPFIFSLMFLLLRPLLYSLYPPFLSSPFFSAFDSSLSIFSPSPLFLSFPF